MNDQKPLLSSSLMLRAALIAGILLVFLGTLNVGIKWYGERILQAGGQPITWIQLACELQRDWARADTTAGFAEIVFASIHP